MPCLPWHSGKVVESTDSKSAGVSSKPTRYVSNFKNGGKECNISKTTKWHSKYDLLTEEI